MAKMRLLVVLYGWHRDFILLTLGYSFSAQPHITSCFQILLLSLGVGDTARSQQAPSSPCICLRGRSHHDTLPLGTAGPCCAYLAGL